MVQLAQERFDAGMELIGSPDTVAERMGEAMEAIGGDGFLISTPFQRISRRFVTEVCEGLVPALQRRGLARTAYTRTLLRDTLREFRAEPSHRGAVLALIHAAQKIARSLGFEPGEERLR